MLGPGHVVEQEFQNQRAAQAAALDLELGKAHGQIGMHDIAGADEAGILHGLGESIALAGAKYNIRCVCIAPGPVLTRPGMAAMKTMAGRAAEPQEIVDLIMCVAGEKGAFINGTYILADGGRNIMFNKY